MRHACLIIDAMLNASVPLSPVPRVNHDGIEGSSLPGGCYLARYGGGDDYAAAEPLVSAELPLDAAASPHWPALRQSLSEVTPSSLKLLHGFSTTALLPGGQPPAAEALAWRCQLCVSRMPATGGIPAAAASPMLHGWLFPTFGQEERKAHQKFPLLAIFGARGLDPPAGETPQWLPPAAGEWSWADQHVHRDEPVDLGGFTFCEVFYGSDMARVAPSFYAPDGGSARPAKFWLAAVDAEAGRGLLTLCVVLPPAAAAAAGSVDAVADDACEAALRAARTVGELAAALRVRWGGAVEWVSEDLPTLRQVMAGPARPG